MPSPPDSASPPTFPGLEALSYTLDDIRRSVSLASFDKGQAYYRAGHVVLEEVEADGSGLEGTVQGSRPAPYRVFVTIRKPTRTGPDGKAYPVIAGDCSCPVGYNCKHSVALMLSALARQEALATAQVVDPSPAAERSEGVAEWLAAFESLSVETGDAYPADVRQRLIYLLSVAADRHGTPRFRVQVRSVRLLKDDRFSAAEDRLYDPQTPFNSPTPARYVLPSDLVILRALTLIGGRMAPGGQSWRTLEGEEGSEMLARLIATGRCRWQGLDGPLLRPGEVRRGELRWMMTADGRQRPEAAVAGESGGSAVVAVLTPPWYIDLAAHAAAPVSLDVPAKMAATFLSAPPLSAAEVAVVRARLAKAAEAMGAGGSVPLPPETEPPRIVGGAPVPRLLLHQRTLQPSSYWGRFGQAEPMAMPLARLTFLYEGVEVGNDHDRLQPTLMTRGELITVKRQPAAEKKAADRLAELGFERLAERHLWQAPLDCRHDLTLFLGNNGDHVDLWLEFLAADLPPLEDAGWQVETAADFPYRLAIADADSDFAAEIIEGLGEGPEGGSGIDWFELHLGVSVDGERVDILPALILILQGLPPDGVAEMLEDDGADGETVYLKLPDQRILPLPFARVRPILRTLSEIFSDEGGGEGPVRLRAADAAALADLEDSGGMVWHGGEGLRRLGRRLRDGGGLPDVVPPASFAGSLRPYQQAGLAWLQLLREVGLGGVLADDMGLGKTVQVLAHLALEKAAGRLDRPCLVVAPTSLMPNWRGEAAAFTPDLSVLIQHGADRKEAFERLAEHDVILTTYALLARDIDVLEAIPWHMVIVDEAQFVKNPATAAAKALRRLETRHRLALTGTPLENHLGELWSLFDFVSPGFLGDAKGFLKTWRTPIEKRGDQDRQKQLARRVKPFLLRRTKADVAADLPPKTEMAENIDLGPSQRALYEGIRLTMHSKIREAIAAKGLKRSRIELLDALLKLRQACCDPRLVKTTSGKASKAGSAKLERLMEMLPELIDEGRRILLFSQFTSMLDIIEAEVVAAKIPFVRLTGQTRDRATPVRRFQAGEVPLFLISLKAGGTGLNLTAADTVIHYDPWWNPAVEAQATDRAHRIGQDKPVFVHKLVALDTIEVKMAALKSRKQALADGLFDPEGGGALDISEDDVEFLLGEAPL